MHERRRERVPARQFVDLEEPWTMNGVRDAAGGDRGLNLVRSGSVAAEDQVPGGAVALGRGPAIERERADETGEVLFGDKTVDGEKIRRIGQAAAPDRRSAGGLGPVGIEGVVHRVVALR